MLLNGSVGDRQRHRVYGEDGGIGTVGVVTVVTASDWSGDESGNVPDDCEPD
jgi:hypothetical protein